MRVMGNRHRAARDVPVAEFVRAWEAAASLPDLARTLNIERRDATFRAADLRRKGVRLKCFDPAGAIQACALEDYTQAMAALKATKRGVTVVDQDRAMDLYRAARAGKREDGWFDDELWTACLKQAQEESR